MTLTRAARHALVVALARDPSLVRFARRLVREIPPRDRLARVATLFTFVRGLIEAPRGPRRAAHVLVVGLASLPEGPALLLGGLLLALGERVRLEDTRELTFVRVAIGLGELRRLPPHAVILFDRAGRRCDLSLDPRAPGGALGFLPRPVRRGIGRRRALRAASF